METLIKNNSYLFIKTGDLRAAIRHHLIDQQSKNHAHKVKNSFHRDIFAGDWLLLEVRGSRSCLCHWRILESLLLGAHGFRSGVSVADGGEEAVRAG